MKLKHIFFIAAVALGFAACTSETSVEPEDGETSLSIVLSINNQTKASEGDLIEPDDNEEMIKRFHIALFDEAGNRIDSQTGDAGLPENGSGTEHEGSIEKIYSATFTDIPKNKPLQVYVLANYTDEIASRLSTLHSYEAYTKETVTSTTPFNAKELVKVGRISVSKIPANNTIIVPLVQLSARIDVKIENTGTTPPTIGDAISWEPINNEAYGNAFPLIDEAVIEAKIGKEYLVSTIESYLNLDQSVIPRSKWVSDLVDDNDKSTWNISKAEDWFRNKDKVYNFTEPGSGVLYYNAQLQGNGYKTDFKFVIFQRDVLCYVKRPVTGLVAGASKVAGGNKKSDITIYSLKEAENTAVQPFDPTPFSGSFYTYENGNLTLSVETGMGTSYYIYKKTMRQYGYKICRGQWLNSQHTAYDWEGTSQGFPKTFWLPILKDEIVVDSDEVVKTEPGDGTLGEPKKTYTITINKDIIKGHVYQVKGTYTPTVEVTPTIKWEVIGFPDPVDVEIGFN